MVADAPVIPRGLIRLSLLIAAAAWIPMVIGFFVATESTLRSYLFAFCVFAAIPLGSLAILCIQYLTGAVWGVVMRRPLEAAVRTLNWLPAFFTPLFLGVSTLYPWANGEYQPPYPKNLYLNSNGFWLRAIAFFVILPFVGNLLCTWSIRQDAANPPGYGRRSRMLSGPALALYGIGITFASIDWVMSLEPEWFSTIYGVIFGMGQILSAFAFSILVVLAFSDQPPLRGVLVRAHLRDFGGMLLTFVMLWMYMHVSQLILIWSGNLQEESPYYARRLVGIWPYIAVTVVLAQFVLPFLILLMRDGKRNPRTLAWVAGMILASRVLENYWLVAPGRPIEGSTLFLTDIAALPAVGGLWFAAYLWALGRQPMLPRNESAAAGDDHHG